MAGWCETQWRRAGAKPALQPGTGYMTRTRVEKQAGCPGDRKPPHRRRPLENKASCPYAEGLPARAGAPHRRTQGRPEDPWWQQRGGKGAHATAGAPGSTGPLSSQSAPGCGRTSWDDAAPSACRPGGFLLARGSLRWVQPAEQEHPVPLGACGGPAWGAPRRCPDGPWPATPECGCAGGHQGRALGGRPESGRMTETKRFCAKPTSRNTRGHGSSGTLVGSPPKPASSSHRVPAGLEGGGLRAESSGLSHSAPQGILGPACGQPLSHPHLREAHRMPGWVGCVLSLRCQSPNFSSPLPAFTPPPAQSGPTPTALPDLPSRRAPGSPTRQLSRSASARLS